MVKKAQEEHGGGEGWLVSYCDMISLLVTFFLMMMTFSTSSSGDVKSVGVGLLKGRGGVFPNLTGYGPAIDVDQSTVSNLSSDLDKQRSKDDKNRVVLDAALDGLAIDFGSECSFAPGSFAVNDALQDELAKLGKMLGKYDQLVLVEGHVDGKEAETRDAERLGLERAVVAAHALLDAGSLRPDQVQIASAGASKLRAVEGSALGRKLNRRVGVRVLAVTREHALGWAGGSQGAK
ncbi:MAG: OmpA family protein [Planctomycetes bacterium]|nr:OmpA family protein [Planctomycetota bacterium]